MLLCQGRSWADFIPPGEVHIVTERYVPEKTDFSEETCLYSISWQGIPVANATVSLRKDPASNPSRFVVRAEVQTAKVIDLLFRLRHYSEATMEAGTLRPMNFTSFQTENSRQRLREIAFGDNGLVKARYWKTGKEIETFEFSTDNPVFDPLSAAVVAKSLPLEVGKEVSFDVFTAKHRFLIHFRVLALETISSQGKPRQAFKIEPRVVKLTDTAGEDKFRSAWIWVAADETRDILGLESKVWIGSVRGKLVKITPRPSTASAEKALRAGLSE